MLGVMERATETNQQTRGMGGGVCLCVCVCVCVCGHVLQGHWVRTLHVYMYYGHTECYADTVSGKRNVSF